MRTPPRLESLVVCILATVLSPNVVAQDPAPSFVAELGTPSALPQDGVPDILVATATSAGVVKLFSGAPEHAPIAVGAPFGPSFPGGLRIAAGDVNGDGIADGAVAMGPGSYLAPGLTSPVGGLLRIYNGLDASLIGEGHPFGPTSMGGLFVAIGDVDGDGSGEIVAAEGAGAHVRVYSIASGAALLDDFTPYGSSFVGGIRIATGDVNGDGLAEIITAPAVGAGTVKIFGVGATLIGEIVPFDPGFAGGVFVAAGDVDGDGRADLVASTSAGPGHVKVFSGLDGTVLLNLGPGLPSGISVATGDLNADRRADIIAGTGPGSSPIVGVLDGLSGALLFSFVPDLSWPGFAADGDTGLVVAAFTRAGIRFTSADHASFAIGQSNAFTVMTQASPSVSSITQTGTLPAGVTFTDNHDGTATLGGTPNPETHGTHTLTFTASNSFDPPATQTFTLQIPEPCPVITISSSPSPLPNGVVGTAYAGATFSQVGAPAGGTWGAANLPPGLTVNPNTGMLSGTPTMTGVFNGSVSYTGVRNCQGTTSVAITSAPNAQSDTYHASLGNTQIVVAGHSSPSTPHFSFAASVLANDVGQSLVVTPVTAAATSLGGQITIAPNGAFTYTPQVGDTGNDSYTYTVMSNGVSAQATITLALGTQRVWYTNPGAGAGDGRSNAPFNSLASVNASETAGDADAEGDVIYLHSGSHTGDFWTEAGQTLWGAGTAFAPVAGLTIPAGPVATILGSVTIVGDNVTISSIAISADQDFGIGAANVSGLTIKNDVTVSANGASYGVRFVNVNSTAGGAPSFGINFRSVSAQNTQFAIYLANVNQASGSFTIAGDGGASNNGSGGLIQNAAVRFQLVRNVSLGYLTVDCNGSIFSGIYVQDASGTYVVDHLDISNCAEGLSALNVATSVVFSVANSRFSQSTQAYGAWFGVSQGGTLEVTVDNSVFEDNVASGIATFIDTGVLGATVRNNIMTGNRNSAIHAATLTGGTAASLLRLRIEHNTIGTPGAFDSGGGFLGGILVEGMGDARVIGLVSDNDFHEVADGSAIEVRRRNPSTAAAQPMDVTVTNNVVTVPSGTNIPNPSCAPSGLPCPSAPIALSADDLPGSPAVLNVHVSGNTAYDPNHEFTLANTEGAYRLAELGGGTLQLVGSGDAATQIASTNMVSPPSPTGVRVDAGVTVIPGPIATPP